MWPATKFKFDLYTLSPLSIETIKTEIESCLPIKFIELSYELDDHYIFGYEANINGVHIVLHKEEDKILMGELGRVFFYGKISPPEWQKIS